MDSSARIETNPILFARYAGLAAIAWTAGIAVMLGSYWVGTGREHLAQAGMQHLIAVLAHIFVWLLGLGGIVFAGWRLRREEVARQGIEKTLRGAEIRYRTLFEQSPDGVLIIDPQTTLAVEFNLAAHRQLGYTRNEFAALRLPDYEANEKPEETRAHIERVLREGLAEFETRHRTKQGEIRNVLVMAQKIELSGCILLHCIFRDITERKRTESLLMARSRVLEQLSVAGTFDEILAGFIQYVGQLFPGHPASVLMLDETGRRLHNGVSTGLPAFYNQAIEGLEIGPTAGSCGAAAYSGQGVIVEDIETHPNWVPFRALARQAGLGACWSEPIHSSTGKVLGTFAVYSTRPTSPSADDMQLFADAAHLAGLALDRQRVEETLWESERRYKSLFDNAGDAIFIVDMEGRLLEVNVVACERLGYSREELLQKTMMELEFPQIAALIPERTKALLESGRVIFETTLARRDGTTIPVETSARLIEYAGRSVELRIVRDITERKRAQIQLAWEAESNSAEAELARAFLVSTSINDISDLVLEQASRLTGSAFGFVGYLDPETGYLVTPTLAKGGWDRCQISGKRIVFEKPVGLWGWVLQNHHSLLTNAPASDPRSSGVPEGHIPIQRFLSAPALQGDTLIGQVALANSGREYTERDLALVERLAALYALAIQRVRMVGELNHFAEELEQRVEQRTGELFQANVLLEQEVAERMRAEQDARRGYEIQSTIDALLRFSLEDIALEEILQRALDTTLAIPWLSFESKGAVFLARDDQVLMMVAQKGLAEPVQRLCAQVPFGRCLCGRAALTQDLQFATHVDERHEICYEAMPPHGHYCVPILFAGRILGVLNIYTREGHRREQREEEFLTGIVNALAGIVMQRKTGESLRESEQRYRALFESAREGIIVFGPDGDLLSANQATAVMLGYNSPEEVVGMQAIDFYADVEQRKALSKELMDKGYAEDYELVLRRKDATPIYVLGSVTMRRDGEGNFRRMEGIFTNITERKQMEIELREERATLAQRVAERTLELSRANAELARNARLKDQFMASMSHELRTPLNAILGLSEALREGVYDPLNERQNKSLSTIWESGHHLLALINDILDVSKIEAGKLELEIGPVSVESVWQTSLSLIRQSAHSKRLKVSSRCDSAVTTLQADERRLKQILVNLLSNAVKFTPEGGEIGLEVVGDEQAETVRFTVWDTGIGIATEDMQRLFQPFVQLDSRLSRQYVGTGLGLALVCRLAEMHGGSISVQSQVGQGSRFTVSLPWRIQSTAVGQTEEADPRESEVMAVPAGAADQQAVERPLILLAEDNEINVSTISDYLLAKGYRVIVARNGVEAIERAREQRPDLILMDIQMPGMDGLAATHRLRAIAELAGVPIIALTALAMPGDRERCLAAGANEYLSKPVSLKGLLQVIEEQRRHSVDDGKPLQAEGL